MNFIKQQYVIILNQLVTEEWENNFFIFFYSQVIELFVFDLWFQTGKMSEIMDGVSDKIRARLDDLKRTEIQRLRQVAKQRFQQASEYNKIHILFIWIQTPGPN